MSGSISPPAAFLCLAFSAIAPTGTSALQRTGPANAPPIIKVAEVKVKSEQKISAAAGGFAGMLDDSDWFGSSVARLSDLDGDGTEDLAVGAPNDDDGGGFSAADVGAVWVLFLNPNGTVRAEQKISMTAGGFQGTLEQNDSFGSSVACLGDLDGDGTEDLAVGAPNDDDGGPGEGEAERGAVWVLFLNQDGSVKAEQKISDTSGGLEGALENGDFFGSAVAGLGDLDGDGIGDLAVGAPFDDDGGVGLQPARGAVWVLFLNQGGTVKAEQKISDTVGGFQGMLDDGDLFGFSLAGLGDLDGDGTRDLAAGAPRDDDGGGGLDVNRGAVWMLFLNPNGTVKIEQKISDTAGNFQGTLNDFDWFGSSLASLADMDGDGTGDLAVGAMFDDDGGFDRGAMWLLFLDPEGMVHAAQKISAAAGGFAGTLDDSDWFGSSVAGLGDLDGDLTEDIAVGAPLDDDGGAFSNRGAVWVLFLKNRLVLNR